MNNPALYDSALSAIAASNGAWLFQEDPGDYSTQVSAAETLATEIDAKIPAVPTITLSERALMESIVKSVMIGRNPSLTVNYADIAESIAATFIAFATHLADSSTGGGSFTNLTDVDYVDWDTPVPGPQQTGNIEAPFRSLHDAIDDARLQYFLAPGDYSPEGNLPLSRDCNITGLNQSPGLTRVPAITIAELKTVSFENLVCDQISGADFSATCNLRNCNVSTQACKVNAINSGVDILNSINGGSIDTCSFQAIDQVTITDNLVFKNTKLLNFDDLLLDDDSLTVTFDDYTYGWWYLYRSTLRYFDGENTVHVCPFLINENGQSLVSTQFGLNLDSDGLNAFDNVKIYGLPASSNYNAIFEVDVTIYTNADHLVNGTIKVTVQAAISVSGGGVATVTFLTAPTVDVSLVAAGLAGVTAGITNAAGGFTVTAQRPAGVHSTARYELKCKLQEVTV